MISAARYHLRATLRCLLEDLGVDVGNPNLVDQHEILRVFHTKRFNVPTGQETIGGLACNAVVYSLHASRWRGATWHQESRETVWLLAARLHCSGEPDDAYPYFRQLAKSRHLLPTREDLEAAEDDLRQTLARSLRDEVPALLDMARSQPRMVLAGVLADRIDVRVIAEPGDPSITTVAISQRIRPGEIDVPPDWVLIVAAAFLPGTPADRLSITWELGAEPLRPDEMGFCDFDG
jgi:hypothetical protein